VCEHVMAVSVRTLSALHRWTRVNGHVKSGRGTALTDYLLSKGPSGLTVTSRCSSTNLFSLQLRQGLLKGGRPIGGGLGSQPAV
jgi:hypothetical protein